MLSNIPMREVIHAHETRHRPDNSRFHKSIMAYWGCIIPQTALVDDRLPGLAFWVESFYRESDECRSYLAKVCDLRTGQIDSITTPDYDPYEPQPRRKPAEVALAWYIEHLISGQATSTPEGTGRGQELTARAEKNAKEQK